MAVAADTAAVAAEEAIAATAEPAGERQTVIIGIWQGRLRVALPFLLAARLVRPIVTAGARTLSSVSTYLP